MDLRDLRYFATIAELKHLGRAAEALHRSQPALTKCIQRLEEALGSTLFERKGRGIDLTAVGKQFLLTARKILDTNDRSMEDMSAFIEGSAGKVRVGCGPITADYVLPILCKLVLEHTPNVSLEVLIGTTYFLKEQLRQDQLDLIVGGVSDDDEFVNQAFIDDVVTVAARKDHPIFESSGVGLRDLLNYQWILPTPQIASRKWLDNVFASRKLPKPAVRIETNALPSVHNLIGGTDLLCFLSRLTVDHPKSRGLLKEVALKETTLMRKLGIIYLPGTLTPAATRLIELLSMHYSNAAE
ncbi:LysR family transcriptional regulator [Pollutimonas bauzanensis]|uniref:DNA-binding transcriptional regulator, LysR family n=1 Tax=Pollutimonas bauzanensis TaxID=658167 RepID=A0A1M5X9P1_9BURK|nr:LysR family transcriptional regulator [Pollutimonas bauzanensis]SHH96555.1 DNA-binding transcriptional regulator, LysR family [Pollutimonas bauzanensis]